MSVEVVQAVVSNPWLEPKVVAPAISVLVSAVIVPFALHVLKSRRERADRILEIRTKVYSEYFKKFEEASQETGNEYEHFSKVTLKEQCRKLLESNNHHDALLEFQASVNEFPFKIQSAHRKATQEVTTLQVLGSPKLFELTIRFESLHQELLELSPLWIEEFKQGFIADKFDSPIASQMKSKGEEIKVMKQDIINQMRAELELS
ncbi:hypothetical protein [Vibrio caribbeanicus]|uniref:hypothetical protein n=1 Tax=Vibrio caribbeanicus TaxID=701175 RepID=UPI0022848F03|nr:hypothetical protein [Vibrio caribbeanicus]MCY9843075.1 hypothetical protein [Vibrio caribbeanicus]